MLVNVHNQNIQGTDFLLKVLGFKVNILYIYIPRYTVRKASVLTKS